jgi:hypothetical protein
MTKNNDLKVWDGQRDADRLTVGHIRKMIENMPDHQPLELVMVDTPADALDVELQFLGHVSRRGRNIHLALGVSIIDTEDESDGG